MRRLRRRGQSHCHRTVGLVIFDDYPAGSVDFASSSPAKPLKEGDAENLKTLHTRNNEDERLCLPIERKDHKPTKTDVAFIWECKHRWYRLTSHGWYNCSSGIELFAVRFEKKMTSRCFLGRAAGVVGLIIIAYVFQRADKLAQTFQSLSYSVDVNYLLYKYQCQNSLKND
jgi:hypothetical protein